jgi:NADH:ubiquinone oxidoreductase subunit 6 (subunit J)
MGFINRLAGVFFYPSRVFQSLQAHPSSVLALIIVVLAVLASLPLLSEVNSAFTIEQLKRQNPAISQEEIDRTVSMISGPTGMVIGAVSIIIFMPAIMVFYAFLFRMVFQMAIGGEVSFRQSLSIVAHANLISVLAMVVIVPLTLYTGQPGTTLNLGALAPFLDENAFVYRLLKNVDVFIGWWLGLLSIGFGILYRVPAMRAGKMLFALWGLWIVVKTAVTPMLSGIIPGM